MINLLEIRKEKKLDFVFPALGSTKRFNDNAAVFINLYYKDTLSLYLPYIKEACRVSRVYIASSDDFVLGELEKFVKKNKLSGLCRIIRKENRGRDISALLIAFAPYIFKYKYICFLHDKDFLQYGVSNNDREEWTFEYWDNLLASSYFIDEVIRCFEDNPELGMLVSPEHMGLYDNAYYRNCWDACFEGTKKLAEQLHLNLDLDINCRPPAVSTAFWTRTECLKKLYQRGWKYEDFPDEPLPSPCISHYIERLIGYLPQDSDMYTGTVQTARNNSRLKEKSQDALIKCFDVLKDILAIDTVGSLHLYQKFIPSVNKYKAHHSDLYLYGAGQRGRKYLKWLTVNKIEIKGFIVSEKGKTDNYLGYPVYALDDIQIDESIGIIIAVSEKLAGQIENNLKIHGIHDYIKI